jgi:peptidoglycan/LPS O-acetylase OafA/YrhL
VRAPAVPIAVVVAASVIGAVVDSRYWFGDNVVLVVVLFLVCVLAVVNTWEFWAPARGSRRSRTARRPPPGARTTGQ